MRRVLVRVALEGVRCPPGLFTEVYDPGEHRNLTKGGDMTKQRSYLMKIEIVNPRDRPGHWRTTVRDQSGNLIHVSTRYSREEAIKNVNEVFGRKESEKDGAEN
jgi:hypothetical protein